MPRKPKFQIYTKDYIKEKLAEDHRWMIRALITLYECQTDAEKVVEKTTVTNGKGFGKYDAEFMSSVALQYKNTKSLSPKQIYTLGKRLPKYWKQVQKAIEIKSKIKGFDI